MIALISRSIPLSVLLMLMSCSSNDGTDKNTNIANDETRENYTIRRLQTNTDYVDGSQFVGLSEYGPTGTIVRETDSENGVLSRVSDFVTRCCFYQSWIK